MKRAKAGGAATVAAVLTVVLHVAGSLITWNVAKEGIDTNPTLDGLLVRRTGEFVWPFADPVRGAMVVAFLAGLVITAFLTWSLTYLLVRSMVVGSRALPVFLGTWMALLVASVAGKTVWTVIYVNSVLDGRAYPGVWPTMITRVTWWAFLLGWLAAGAAALAYTMSNRREPSSFSYVSPYQPLTPSGPLYGESSWHDRTVSSESGWAPESMLVDGSGTSTDDGDPYRTAPSHYRE
ncbi:hypothetical protein [Luteipulveratus mongoliensis]|uniref:Uncharacterized protein n=1 Tax=Luteipulveratus mongoliensis TaxID=571913 RepID=A0A0K1JKU1_9MICO|nr:hypothetical protein [Luteipulveratus mongoliensis]AKU17332.1 hypothetical protein VV02_18195 [Luteipulveratus mongoliensis]